jgi:hypothetical protein
MNKPSRHKRQLLSFAHSHHPNSPARSATGLYLLLGNPAFKGLTQDVQLCIELNLAVLHGIKVWLA